MLLTVWVEGIRERLIVCLIQISNEIPYAASFRQAPTLLPTLLSIDRRAEHLSQPYPIWDTEHRWLGRDRKDRYPTWLTATSLGSRKHRHSPSRTTVPPYADTLSRVAVR